MVYHFLYPLSEYFSFLNVTQYITVRAGGAFIFSFLFVLIFWKVMIGWLRSVQFIEKIDMCGHEKLQGLYQGKQGTPTMGGIIILLAILLAAILWSRWDVQLVWCFVFILVSLGAVGFSDDWLKLKRGEGLSRLQKFSLQSLCGLLLGVFVLFILAILLKRKSLNLTDSINSK